MKRNKLISLAQSFVAFLIESVDIDQAILFGSVANNEFDEESDIDIFIDTEKKNEKKIDNALFLFEKSDTYQKYVITGIKNKISLKIGKLDKWPSLKRSIISNGIMLYGKYKEKPSGLKQYTIITMSFKNVKRKDKVKIWRKLYGYKQRVGKKTYVVEGISKLKLGNSCILIKPEEKNKIKDILKKYRIRYKIYEIWSDTIS